MNMKVIYPVLKFLLNEAFKGLLGCIEKHIIAGTNDMHFGRQRL